jgi:hypothetical protein
MHRVAVLAAICTFLFSLDTPAWADKNTKSKKMLAQYLVTVADDFIVDVYHNGERVPDSRRKLLLERFGATAERIDVPVQAGDWLVFNVVNNRLRWGGAYYFAVAGILNDETTVGFTTELDTGRWSCCDNPSNVNRFISDRDFLSTNPAHPVQRPWHEGDKIMEKQVTEWAGSPIWGSTRNTWMKFVAR